METTSSSRVGAQTAEAPAPAGAPGQEPDTGPHSHTQQQEAAAPVPAARRTAEGFLAADFPWYGLDGAFTGPRWLMQVAVAADGTVEHGSTGHGDEPSARGEIATGEKERFAVVITVASNPLRRSGDGTGVLEATSVASAAWLAGSGLLAYSWPGQMDHSLRDDWLDQQTRGRLGAGGRPGRRGLVHAVAAGGRGADAVPLPRVGVRVGAGRVHRQRCPPGCVRPRHERVRARLRRDRGPRFVRVTSSRSSAATDR